MTLEDEVEILRLISGGMQKNLQKLHAFFTVSATWINKDRVQKWQSVPLAHSTEPKLQKMHHFPMNYRAQCICSVTP